MIADRISEHRKSETHYCESPGDMVELLEQIVRPGDMVLTLGAGNIFQVGETLLTILQERKEP
jgi:UDP-N-acetylmuramate--alanine ligase